jgi:hypothetical protein
VTPRRSSLRIRRLATAAAAVALGAALVPVAAGPTSAADGGSSTGHWPRAVAATATESQTAAALVTAEDRRITQIRTVSSLARWQGRNWKTPYRLSTPAGYTLVLTAGGAPYTLTDLLKLAPQTLLRMSDGSYLLTEHIAVMPRATLRLSSPGGLHLRLASSAKGFSTITSLGGRLELVGEQNAPLELTSWDADRGAVDTVTFDGRAYVRAIGGQFRAEHVEVSNLGFWSGRTGGISLTGTDRPNTGAIVRADSAARTKGSVPSILDDVQRQTAGPLQQNQTATTLKYTVPAADYVSSSISDTTITGSAYGLFVSGADGLSITDTTVRDSAIAGIVLHRFVKNGSLTRTTAVHNAGNGFTLDRATTGVTINESTAKDNAGSGFVLSGRPLADGPSAVGSTTASYGNNSVANSLAEGNAHYGIQVLGGSNVGVQNNRVVGNDMGVVVDGPAERVSVTGNDVVDTARHGIALVDGVTASTVTGNVVSGASTAVYVRDSSVRVKGNTVQDASSHGVSLVGNVRDSDVSFNVLSGTGASALDTVRSSRTATTSGNATTGWHDTTPWYFWFKKLLQPMNSLWALIALLALVSAVRSRRYATPVVHPYAHQMAHHGHLPIPAPAAPERPIDLTALEAGVSRP